MANVRINRQKAELGQLGNACICCGAAAQTVVPHDFYWRPTWFLIVRLFLGRLGRLLFWRGREYVTCRVPVCAKHTGRLRLPTYIGIGVIVWLVLGTILSIALTSYANAHQEQSSLGTIVAGVFFLPMLVIGPGTIALQVMTPRAEDFDDGAVHFVAVSPQFAASASGQTGGYGSSGGGAAPSGYGATSSGYGGQPSYGAQGGGYGAGGYGGAPLAPSTANFPAPAAPRTWTDVTGQHRIQATFVRIDGAIIELQRTDGRTIRMPLAQLCAQDQAFAQSQSIF